MEQLTPTMPASQPGGAAAVNPLALLLSPGNILCDLDVPSKGRALDAIGRLLGERHGLAPAAVAAALAAREDLGSTGLGQGMAIPHARMKGLRHVIAGFVRLLLPIPFDAPDSKPVSAMLVLLVPERASEEHLQLLAWAVQMFADRRFREELGQCADAEAIHRLFACWTAR